LFHAKGQTPRKTDSHDEANSRLSQSCESVQKPQWNEDLYLIALRKIFLENLGADHQNNKLTLLMK
jgi:hypothetical protein